VINLFFFFGEFFDELGVLSAMMDHRLNNFAKVYGLTMSKNKLAEFLVCFFRNN
jgi:hypothetical protein